MEIRNVNEDESDMGRPTGPACGDLTGTYPCPQIAPLAVTTPKLANGAVTASKLADGAVSTNKLDDDAVTTTKLNDDSVTTLKLADSAVTTDKLNNGAVTEAKIGASAVIESKIQNGAVTTDKLNNGAVTDVQVAAANKDGTAATPSMRTLGTGAQQAAPGDDARFNPVITIPVQLGTFSNTLGAYPVRSMTNGGGTCLVGIQVPADCAQIVACRVRCSKPGSALPTADIDLASNYAAVGEAYDTHGQSETGSTYSIPGSDQIFELNLLPVLTSLAAGDIAGVTITNNTAANIRVYSGYLTYRRHAI